MKGAEYIHLMESGPLEILNEKQIIMLFSKYSFNIKKRAHLRNTLTKYIKDHEQHYQTLHNEEEFLSHIIQFYNETHKGDLGYYYDNLPEQEIWRCFVDVDKQKHPGEQGWVGYEKREPGCIQQMYDALQFMSKTMTEALTPNYIQQLHQIAAQACPKLEQYGGWGVVVGYLSIQPGKFKDREFGDIIMPTSSISVLGLVELMPKIKSLTKSDPYIRICPRFPAEGYEAAINDLIGNYQAAVQAGSLKDKLIAIVHFVQELDRLHPFKDGNTRVFETLLLNRELVRHGFIPSLLNDPNHFIGHSLQEAIVQVIQGMENYRLLRSQGYIPGAMMTTELLQQGIKYPLVTTHRMSLTGIP